MKQYFKSALLVAALAAGAAFTPASAAVSHSTLPFAKEFSTGSPMGFTVEVGQNNNEESVHFSVMNHTGSRLRCTLKGPDGSILETIYIKSKYGETTRNYLFDSADEGTYSIEVTDGKEKVVKKIDLRRVKTIVKAEFNIQ